MLMAGVLLLNLQTASAASPNDAGPYGVSSRVVPDAYLRMPSLANGRIPRLLSQTGAFKDVRNLVPNDSLLPYDIVVSFWSDGAEKRRWVAIPQAKIHFSRTGEWTFPRGTVFIKTFELPTDAADPKVRRRLETRLLVLDGAGGVYGVVYKWRPDNSDADLLPDSLTENIPIQENGQTRQQAWYYPSRKDCLTCHTAQAHGVLGVKTRQLNHPYRFSSGITDNELRAWNHLGLFEPAFGDEELQSFAKLAPAADTTRTLEDRARSYLDANCSQCHRPGGTVANFDARYDTPLEQQQLVNGAVLIDEGIDRPRIISPHDIWRSIMFMRVNTMDDIRMPPLDRRTVDQKGVELLRDWIDSLPGRPVLPPPVIQPAGGTYDRPIEISLTDGEPEADIRYTLDGSAPGPSDMRYDKPIKLTEQAILRTRAFKEGFTRSITAQQVFIVGK